MATANAIANIGLTLIERLRAGLPSSVADADVELMSPADLDKNSTVRLTLHLYEVDENEHMRNVEPPATGATVETTQPLRLDLRYLLTAYPSDVKDETANTEDQHEVLGRAMQILREDTIIPGPEMEGSFDDDEAIHISILPESTNVAVNVWNTFENQPYRPSVAYLVTPVIIESSREQPIQRVVEQEYQQYTPLGGDEGDGDA
ncbi:MAG: DUF4255 domain-containing protein [Halobacteriales archaeon]|nr:DUF4255 domain-containing protein [Halobacteriales archaeon]